MDNNTPILTNNNRSEITSNSEGSNNLTKESQPHNTSSQENPIMQSSLVSKKKRLKTKIIILIIAAIAIFALGTITGYAIREFTNSPSTYPTGNDSTVYYKPIIYLYPKETTKVSITLGKPQLLTSTYPKYHNGWQVIAEPNGTLHNLDSTRDYYGLYWEGSGNHTSLQKDGFIVSGTETEKFLEEKLALLGLTDREANEFIIYWLPKLEKSPYNYIRFETKSEIDNYMPLTVTPKPDSVIRIIMDYQPLDQPIEILPQQLTTPERHGFTVVEWGGTKIGAESIQ